MKCAQDPTGSIQPVALKTGLNIRRSRHYLIAFAVIGVVYLLYASLLLPLHTHDLHDQRRGQIDLALQDHSTILGLDHDRASMKSDVGVREKEVNRPQDWLETIQKTIEEQEYAPQHITDTKLPRYRIGANGYNNGLGQGEGAAFVHHGGAAGVSTTSAWSVSSGQANAQMGSSVAYAGDVNGDGYADVVVRVNEWDNGENNEGQLRVYHGSASGLATTTAWTFEGDQVDARIGTGAGYAGDVNGDGYADLIVGLRDYDNGETDEGQARLFLGSSSGLKTVASWSVESNQASAKLASTNTIGDVNGDGFSDVGVGARTFDNGETDEGKLWVYLGSSSGLATSSAWSGEGNQATAYYGLTQPSGGDANNDGYSDLLTSAYAFDNGQTDEGQAYLYRGSASGLATTTAWTARGESSRHIFRASSQFCW